MKEKEEFKKYLNIVKELNEAYYKANGYTEEKIGSIAVSFKEGSRFIKVFAGNNLHTFIDNNGDILKVATYNSPSKIVRGSIFSTDNGRSVINHFGANYLR